MENRSAFGHENPGRAVHFARRRVLRRFGPSPKASGMKALSKRNPMQRIHRGRLSSLRTADRVLEFISEQDGSSGGGRDPPDARNTEDRPASTDHRGGER